MTSDAGSGGSRRDPRHQYAGVPRVGGERGAGDEEEEEGGGAGDGALSVVGELRPSPSRRGRGAEAVESVERQRVERREIEREHRADREEG